VGVIIAFRSEKGMSSSIPFGPYLALAAIFYIFIGDSFSNWYFGFFLPGL
jgi:leader peptidase (prepilin peptidase)/N-methyltransferase